MKRWRSRRESASTLRLERLRHVTAQQEPQRRVTAPELKSFTGRLLDLPSPDTLLARGRALAIVEIAVNEKADTRQHSYVSGRGERTLWIHTTAGGEALVWTGHAGSVVRGFDHESEMRPSARDRRGLWPGLLTNFPASLADCPQLSAGDDGEALTFCYWWFSGGPWNRGNVRLPAASGTDPDGSWHLLRPLSGDKESIRFLADVYGEEFPTDLLHRLHTRIVDRRTLDMLPLAGGEERVVDELIAAGFRVSDPD